MTKDLNRMAATEVMGWVWSEEHQMWCDGSEGDADGRLTYANPDELDWINDDPDELGHQAPWTPLTDLNQCFQVDREMIKSGWSLTLQTFPDCYVAYYCPIERPASELGNPYNAKVVQNKDMGPAILTAALKAKGVEAK